MSIQLNPDDRRYLERFISRQPRSTPIQRARALLLLGDGMESQLVALKVGMPNAEVADLEQRFAAEGIAALDQGSEAPTCSPRKDSGIEKSESVCAGAARIEGTRIPVWQLVAARDMSVSEAQLLIDYPSLCAKDLINAWSYAETHREELEKEIHENEVA